MREIKFRAWHTEQKKMYLAEEMASDQLCILPTGYFINVNSIPRLSSIDYARKMILLQFTGLKDKNGKEIYEGDVVKDKNSYAQMAGGVPINDYLGQVFFDDETTACAFKILISKGTTWGDDAGGKTHFLHRNVEVIGNIYENGDLLK